MNINVSQLLSEPNGSTRTLDLDEVFSPSYGADVEPVQGTVKLLRTDKGIWVSAELNAKAQCTCSRCLNEYGHPLHMSIEEEFLPLEDLYDGTRTDVPAVSEESFRINQNHILNLTDAIRQYYVLSVPMKPVCREDCAGICLDCGVDLNVTQCTCKSTGRDARWGKLLDLVAKVESTNGGND